jgi:hypothetical protein
LELNERERELIFSRTFADDSLTNRLRVVPKLGERPIFRFSLDNLDELIGFIAAEANHARNKILREQLHQLCDRMEATLNKYTDEATIRAFSPHFYTEHCIFSNLYWKNGPSSVKTLIENALTD